MLGRQVAGIENGPNLELAVVVTVTVKAAAAVPFTVAEVGETVHVEFVGAPVQTNVTVPLNPLKGAAWRL